ncbi:helicase SEN1 [Diachasma alloeum]|uniref:helicase SEN1 n=1 Tax=Diachasma alloeum TaxID=454923 RepID=UPI00073812F5|nr:helicase SEN1 [Diachasma alloeum]
MGSSESKNSTTNVHQGRSNDYSDSYHPNWDDDIAQEDSHLRLDEFLFHIFQWKPEWLTDKQYNAKPPPIVDPKSVISTSLSYEKFEDYCKAMLPLLLLEFWHVLKKDGENRENETEEKGIGKGKGNGKEEKARTVIASFDSERSRSLANGDDQISVLKLVKVMTRVEDYPIRGDLVKFQNGREEFFGYIEECVRTRFPRTSEIEVKYSIKTKKLRFYGSASSELQLTTVHPLGPYLRFVRAMEDLSKSPLFQSVIQPKVEDYELLEANFSSVFPLITGHTLNSKQLEVVARIVKTVAQQSPKICLIQGPPGTGKSKVILNIICEVLKKTNTKILLCAPSNRAIDEVVGNLIAVQKDREGMMDPFTIVRIGREEKMGAEVKEVALSFHSQMLKLGLGPQNKRNVEARILEDADVIATTLSSCYTFQMENLFGKDGLNIPVCIVDEAAQATELGTLIPLMLGVSTLILVGDPKQLPPTVLSEEAKVRGFDESLFYRAKKNFEIQKGNPILMLDTQYRMVEEIVKWPNNFFYQGALRTGSTVPPLPFTNYKLIHHFSHQDQNDSNLGEARLVVNLTFGMVVELVKDAVNQNISIGIITPYRKQRKVILDLLKARYEEHAPKKKKIKIAKAGDVDNNANETSIKVPNHLNITDDSRYDDWEDFLKTQEKKEINDLQISKENREEAAEKDDKENEGENAGENGKTKENYKENEKGEQVMKEVPEKPSPLYLKLKSIQVNTVDSFQGQERDIIIMSCVRSRGIGFVNDPNRLCVSLTRAKHTLVLCGNFKTFKRNQMWNALLADAEARSAYVRLDSDSSVDNIMKHVIVEEKKEHSTDYFLY